MVTDGFGIKGRDFVYETHPYPMKKDWDKCFGEVSRTNAVYVGEWGAGGTNGVEYGKTLMDFVMGASDLVLDHVGFPHHSR